MKLIISFLCALATNLIVHSQNLEKNDVSFLSMKFDTVLGLKSDLNSEANFIKKDDSFSFYNLKPTLYNRIIIRQKINTKELNNKVFSNIRFYENTFTEYTDDIRGCGPLQDGFTKTLNSRDIMLSNIVDNFINNVLFKDRGPLKIPFYSKN